MCSPRTAYLAEIAVYSVGAHRRNPLAPRSFFCGACKLPLLLCLPCFSRCFQPFFPFPNYADEYANSTNGPSESWVFHSVEAEPWRWRTTAVRERRGPWVWERALNLFESVSIDQYDVLCWFLEK